MPIFISMLRGINVGGHAIIKMDQLRDLYGSIGFQEAQTYVQSGNVIFRSKLMDEAVIAKKIRTGIEKTFEISPEVILRTKSEMEKAVAANPFAGRKDIEPSKLLVSFLANKPSSEVRKQLEALKPQPEELHLANRELFVYFPDGIGRSKLTPVLDRILKASATGRNWNSVTKMLEIASKLED